MAEPYWKPSLPQGEARDHALNPTPQESDDAGWVLAPAGSHCWGFRLVDASSDTPEGKFQRKFGDVEKRGYGKGRSRLYVRFRGKDGVGINSEYVYLYDDHNAARNIFDKLTGSAHPYAEVVRPLIIKAGTAYQRHAG